MDQIVIREQELEAALRELIRAGEHSPICQIQCMCTCGADSSYADAVASAKKLLREKCS